ncbi:MAG: hypothetical protein ACRDRU_27165 [Pseudonocardiaceae bacterium]
MSHYRVAARRWEHGWELHIEGAGVTQSRTLAGAARMARDYLALEYGGEPGSYTVEVVPELDGDLAAAAEAARQAVRHAEQEQRRAAACSRKAARDLKAAGLSGADIASVMGVSPQRVSQLVNS